MSTTPHPKKAQVLDDLIAVCVSHGLTDEVTGEIVGTSSRTVRRRRNEPAIAEKVAELVSQRVAAVELELSDLGSSAVRVFQEAMDPDNEMGHRLAGANSTMRHLNAARSTADLELRVEELEAVLKRAEPALARLAELEQAMGQDR